MATFEALVAEGAAVPVEGWDFSWFAGRATEQRPSWAYARRVADRMSSSEAVLDVQTGGGEVYAYAASVATRRPRLLVATESWAPNVDVAAGTLAPSGGPAVRR